MTTINTSNESENNMNKFQPFSLLLQSGAGVLSFPVGETEQAKKAQPTIDMACMKKEIATYRGGDLLLSTRQLALTFLGFLASFGVAIASYDHSFALCSVAVVGGALAILRLFMIQHDCGHGSFLRSKKANEFTGRIIGVLTLTPYQCWRRYHAMHHAGTGNLDKRGFGDIQTLTVNEYNKLSRRNKFLYRMYRNPVSMFLVAPFFLFIIRQRLTYYIPKDWKRERKSVHMTNVAIFVLVTLMSWLIGFETFMTLYISMMTIAATIGVWLFYVQHQFEDAYWAKPENWNYNQAALYGSSYYALPDFVQWLVAHITVHHVHHLDCTVPNYKLKECNENVFGLKDSAPRIGFIESLSCIRYKLWDEQKKQMVTF